VPPLDIQELVNNALHESVTRKRLATVGHGISPSLPPICYIEEDEQPHYLTYSSKQTAYEGSHGREVIESQVSITDNVGHGTCTVWTDQRVISMTGAGQYNIGLSIPYTAIDEVIQYKSGMIHGRVDFRCDQTVYTLRTKNHDTDFLYNAMNLAFDEDLQSRDESIKHLGDPLWQPEAFNKRLPSNRGDFVNSPVVSKVEPILDGDERIHYILKGYTIDVQGDESGESLLGDNRDRKMTAKSIWTAVTDKRVSIYIPQVISGNDSRYVPYRSITSVDIDIGAVVGDRISIQTRSQTYHIQIDRPEAEEVREAAQFIRDKADETHQSRGVVKQEPDPTEQLKRLKELYDDGVLTEEEFIEKKQNILDKIQ